VLTRAFVGVRVRGCVGVCVRGWGEEVGRDFVGVGSRFFEGDLVSLDGIGDFLGKCYQRKLGGAGRGENRK
jgi:hypothetical protein